MGGRFDANGGAGLRGAIPHGRGRVRRHADAPVSPTCPDGADPWVKYELFMGRGNQSGEVVDDAAWDAFLGDTVTPRFPDGLTVLDARGQWRDSEGLIGNERSKLLVILAPPGGGEMRLIDEVTGEYKRRFGQESVLKVVYDACVSFS